MILTTIMGMVSLASRTLKTLSIDNCGVIDAKSLGALLSNCSGTLKCLEITCSELSAPLSAKLLPDLQMLHIYTTGVDTGTVCTLIASSPNLRSFACNDLLSRDTCLEALAAHCPLLQVLSYANSCPDSTAALVHLLLSCPLIEVVDLSSGNDDKNRSANDAHIAAVMQHCINLKAFRAPGISDNITDASILAVATRMQSLHHLCLYDCDVQSDEPILALAEHCGSMKTLELWSHNGGLYTSQDALVALISNLKSVVELSLDYCPISDAVLQAMAAHCPYLECLHIYESTGYSDVGIAAVVQGCAALKVVHVAADNPVVTPLGRRLWSVLCPGIQFSEQVLQFPLWEALEDTERENIVVW